MTAPQVITPPRWTRYYRPVLLLLLAIVAALPLLSVNRYTEGDARGTLVLSQTLLHEQTLKLDYLGAETLLSLSAPGIYERDGHSYYGFPIGTPLLSTPFVGVMNLFGLDALHNEPLMQLLIVAVTSLASFLLLVKIAQLYQPPAVSLLLAAVFWFGTSLTSTLSTALWSHNFAVLFALLAIYSTLRLTRAHRRNDWALIALSLFLAYLCRPTLSLLAPATVLLVLMHDWRSALKISAGFFALFAVFVAHSYYEFSQPLPDYYLPSRLADDSTFWTAFWGNLLSPARGILVFSPFLVPVLVIALYALRGSRMTEVLLLGLLWSLLHLLTISGFEHWWGGGSYGSRFMVDALPGVFLLLIFAWTWLQRHRRGMLFLIPLVGLSILIHTLQGLFNPYTERWNAEPSVELNPAYLFDWRYPQFAAHAQGHSRRLFTHAVKELPMLSPGVHRHDAPTLAFSGWSVAEPEIRWSDGLHAVIGFKLAEGMQVDRLHIEGSTLGTQRIRIAINGNVVMDTAATMNNEALELFNASGRAESVSFQPGLNRLDFEFPDARPPGNGDLRALAFALRSLIVE